MESRLRAGDTVRLLAIPHDLKDHHEIGTPSLFENCQGKTFVNCRISTVEELPPQRVQLEVGPMLGEAPCRETIGIKPKCLQFEGHDNFTTK